MTKRYWVQQDEGAHAGEWQVLNRRTDLDRMWVASFDKKEHADRFAAELNREEGARQRAANDGALLSASLQASMQINQAMQRQYEQMLSEQVMPAVVKHFSAFTQHKDAIPPPAPSDPGRGLIKEYLTKGVDYSSTGDYQVRSVWDPSKFCEPTTRAWNLAPIVKLAPSTTWAIPDEVKRRWATPNRVGAVVYEPEKPQHPNEGERCCQRHAPSIAMFQDGWERLPKECGR